ncbi:MAG: AAA family ATPase [Saprospiraceae bacterium]|nr:AAA family ATPase [Saprospiraceae bacterium]
MQNFRKFKEVEIFNLSLFNIIVGDNNVGKTSLLEAFLFDADIELYLKRLSLAYIDRKNILPHFEVIENFNCIYYSISEKILDEYVNFESKEKLIRFEFSNRRYSWHYCVGIEKNLKCDDSYIHLVITKKNLDVLKFLDAEELYHVPYIPYAKGFGTDLSKIYSSFVSPDLKLEKKFISYLIYSSKVSKELGL